MKSIRKKCSYSRKIGVSTEIFFLFLLIFTSLATAEEWPTVTDSKGIKTEYPQQLELNEYEKQINKKIIFNENPMFTGSVNTGELPSVGLRLPVEPLVLMPYTNIGRYGGSLEGIAISYESGTSEILSWRQANLVRFNDDTRTIEPNVAKAWKWNEDFTEITFVLRKGHRWSDGAPFTTDDIVFYFNDIILNKEIHQDTPAPWGSMGISVEKIDDVTVKLKFEKTYTSLLYYFGGVGSYYDPFAPKHFLKQYHIKYNPKANEEAQKEGFDNWVQRFCVYWNKWKDAIVAKPSGLNVPTLESHILKEVPTPQERIFVANPFYFKIDTAGNQLPYIDFHHERFLEKKLWPLEIMNGNVDQKSQNMPLNIYPVLKENQQKGNYTLQLPSTGAGPTMIFNKTHKDLVLRGIYGDARFNYAMSLAINRAEVNETLFLGLGTPQQALPQNVPFITEADKNFMAEYDPEHANKLLDEMGLKRGPDSIRTRPDGKPLIVQWEYTLQYVWSDAFPALIASYWQKVGISVVLKKVDTKLTREKQKTNTLDITSEWMSPFEPTLFSTPSTFMPSYSSDWLIMGAPWIDWKSSNGKNGEEPPKWVRNLWEIGDEFSTLIPGSDWYMALGKEIIRINLENLTVIGTLGNVPLITVVSNKLGNVPQWTINTTYYGYAYPYRVDQWYFK